MFGFSNFWIKLTNFVFLFFVWLFNWVLDGFFWQTDQILSGLMQRFLNMWNV